MVRETRTTFPKSFKQEAVRLLAHSGRPAAEIARELGIRRNQSYLWQEQMRAKGEDSFPGSGRQSEESEQLRRLHDTLLSTMMLKPTHPPDLRSGLHGPGPVRQAGDGPHRLQSEETRQAILPSARLLQRHDQGLLARRTPTRRCAYRRRRPRLSEGGLYQSAVDGQRHHHQSRQGVLRSPDRRLPRSRACPMRDRGQADAADQAQACRVIVSPLCLRHRDRRVPRSHQSGARGASLCRHPTTHPGGSLGPAFFVYPGKVQLSGPRDQPAPDSAQHAEVLQRPSFRGTHYQRTQGGLSVSENPDEPLCGQRGRFSHLTVLVQPDQLAPTTLPTKAISGDDAQHIAVSPALDSWATGPVRQQVDTQATGKLLIQRRLRSRDKKNRDHHKLIKFTPVSGLKKAAAYFAKALG